MVILLHVLIALASVAWTGFTAFSPSKKRITISYISLLLTIGSGTYLIVTRPAHMVTTCFEGLLFIAVVTIGIIFAQRKLSAEKA